MTPTHDRARARTVGRIALAVGTLAGCAALITLADPGITVDEPLDVRPGRTYVETLLARGPAFFQPDVVAAVFRDNAEHPPMGRWLLGIASKLAQPAEILIRGVDPLGLYLIAGRTAPALSFALLVGLVTWTTGSRYGGPAGAVGGFALATMPRVFAHAHFGALDTFVSLFWTTALLCAGRAVEHRRPIHAMAGAGCVWGLALLTKLHAWFLAPLVFVWTAIRLGPARALSATTAWAACGVTVFFAGWPWLWYHTLARLRGYFLTGLDRSPIHVTYFGQIFADRDVPWHYPWFYFLVTVPVGFQVLGVAGAVRGLRDRRTDPFAALLLGSMALFLVMFSSRVPVYDGERLFLLIFPAWAILIGRGFAMASKWFPARLPTAALIAFVLAQGYGVVIMHPFQLSYFNALVGGLKGAERLGLELTYWNDAVDPVLLDRMARDARPPETAALAPTLYPGEGIANTTRSMAHRPIVLQDEDAAAQADWLVVSRRTAYWKPDLRVRMNEGNPVLRRSRQGVWLSALWHFPKRAGIRARDVHPDGGQVER
jgi:4-amino-4-deoxy-L-arabinose transferase-like glycosyltransferase